MRFSTVLFCIFVALLAIIFGRIYQRLFNVPVPDDFPKNSTWQFKLVGFSFGLAKDLVSFTSVCENKTFCHLAKGINSNFLLSKSVEIIFLYDVYVF